MTLFKKIAHIYRTLLKGAVAIQAAVLIAAAPAFASQTEAPKGHDFTVVIDAGHGGHDHGAIDNGVREKDINLAVAKDLADLIKKKLKDVKVVMTRYDDTFISLQERANIANRNRGDIFISIHTNSVDKSNPNRKSVQGTSVYALGLHKDQDNLKVARRENSVIELEENFDQKYSGFDPNKDESYIIFEMAQKKNLGNSLKFAAEAQRELVSTAGRSDRGVKQAGFWVLWATSMPSVLVELDFICNPTTAAFIGSQRGQEKLAEALFNAVSTYVEEQTGSNPQNSKRTPKAKKKIKKEKEQEISQTQQSVEPAAKAETGTVILASASDTRKVTITPETANAGKRTASRRRRSESGKKASASRSFETDNIVVKSESSYLAIAEEEPTQNVVASDEDQDQHKGKKKDKKNKDKKQKKNKDADKKKSKTDDKKKDSGTSTRGGRRVIRVSSGPSSATSVSAIATNGNNVVKREPKSNVSVSNQKSNANAAGNSTTTMGSENVVYKIQLLSSPEQLSLTDPAFQGLSPIDSFKENGLYKYTYGKSGDRHQIEETLLEVKSKIPDAFIIVGFE